MRLVSVETGLDDIKMHLNACGYQVVDMAECIRPVEAVIYTGPKTDGIYAAKAARGTAVINATGMSGEQVTSYLEEKLG